MNRRWIVGLVAFLLLIGIGSALLVRSHRARSGSIWTVQRGTLEGTIELDGRIAALHPVTVTSSIDDRVQIVAVSPGDTVQAGDILVQLDRRPIDEQIMQAKQQLEQAEAALSSTLQNTQASPDEKIRAEAQRRSAQAAYDQVRANLAKTLIVAPVDGIVTDISVGPGAPVSAGAVVATLASFNDLGVTVTMDETDIRYLSTGQPVEVTVDAFPGQTFSGTIGRISQASQQQGGVSSFTGQVALTPKPSAPLRPGMTATVRVRAILRRDVLLVPERALHTVGQRTFVTVVEPNGQQNEREVTVGLRSNGMAEIAAGLSEGERVLLP
jgi:RND family efflux transporter MFP subunit